MPGGAFALAPLYDVISAYPLVARRQMDRHRMTMAMAALGTSKHYRHEEIVGRHWLSTAKAAAFSQREARSLAAELAASAEAAITAASAELPPGFPDRVASPVLDGLRAMARVLERLGG